jgi:hypothetical protein
MTTVKIEVNDQTAAVLRDLFDHIFKTGAKMTLTIDFLLQIQKRLDNSEQLTPVVSSIKVDVN